MIGKLIGKTVGNIVALPITIVDESVKAVEEAVDTVGRKLDGKR